VFIKFGIGGAVADTLPTRHKPFQSKGYRLRRRRGDSLPLITVAVILGIYLSCTFGCAVPAKNNEDNPTGPDTAVKAAGKPASEPRSVESKSVDPAVAAEIERMEAEERMTLLQDAQSAIGETRNAIAALDKGDKQTALASLERVTGKLDLLIARDPEMDRWA
jgi:hypothetical protein